MKPDITLSSGMRAPAFEAIDQNNESVSLGQFAGKTVVLYFYPRAMTPGCTTQACELTQHHDAFASRNCVVLGVSPDLPEKLKRFEAKYQLAFTLLSDPDHVIASQYGVWGPKKFMGRVFDGIHRATFIIGPTGDIQETLYPVKTKTHHADVLALLDTL